MRLLLRAAALILALSGLAGAETSTTLRDYTGLRAVEVRVTYHDVRLEVVNSASYRLTVTTEADGPDAAKYLEQIQPELGFQGGVLTVRLPNPPGGKGLNRRGRVVLAVPPGATLRVRAISGDIGVVGLDRTASASLGSRTGSIDVQVGGTSLGAATGSGGVRVAGRYRNMTASSESGDIAIAGAVGRLRASSISGNLRLDRLGGDLDAQTVSGAVRAVWQDAPRPAVQVTTYSGDISLYFPTGAAPGGQLTTLSGQLGSDFSGLNGDQAAGASLRLNGSGPRLNLNSTSGDINLRRR